MLRNYYEGIQVIKTILFDQQNDHTGKVLKKESNVYATILTPQHHNTGRATAWSIEQESERAPEHRAPNTQRTAHSHLHIKSEIKSC